MDGCFVCFVVVSTFALGVTCWAFGSTSFLFLGNWFLFGWLFALLLELAFFGWLCASSIWGRFTTKFIIWEVIADEHGIDPTGTLDTLIYELPCDRDSSKRTSAISRFKIMMHSFARYFPLKQVWVLLERQFSAALSI